MFRKFVSYTIILIFIAILSTLFPYINYIISRVNYPLDIVFFEIRNNYSLLTKNADYLKNLEESISNSIIYFEIQNKNIDLKTTLTPGIFINEDSKYIYVKTTQDVKNEEIAFTRSGEILGFVSDSFKNNKIIKKLGWGNHEIFGEFDNIELLIKESGNGNLIINIPEGFSIFQNKKHAKILISDSNWLNTTLSVEGFVYKKSNNIYYIVPDKLKDNVILFSEFGVK